MKDMKVIEKKGKEVQELIKKNVIQIKEGKILIEKKMLYKGIRKDVKVGMQVQRVGYQEKIKEMKKVEGQIKGEIEKYSEMDELEKLG